MPEYYRPRLTVGTILSPRSPLCPAPNCHGHMQTQSTHQGPAATGLQALQCTHCGHRGFRPLAEMYVVFGGRHEHVCCYGPSTKHVLNVVFCETALGHFLDAYLSPTESVLYAAYWTLLCGQATGTVNMAAASSTFWQCFGHFSRQYAAHSTQPDESKQTDSRASVVLQSAEQFDSLKKKTDCEHDYQLETVGGVFITGAYVCRLCSFRIGMSHDEFHQHADYPRHYQEDNNTAVSETPPVDGKTTRTKV